MCITRLHENKISVHETSLTKIIIIENIDWRLLAKRASNFHEANKMSNSPSLTLLSSWWISQVHIAWLYSKMPCNTYRQTIYWTVPGLSSLSVRQHPHPIGYATQKIVSMLEMALTRFILFDE
jgi:hypothetical protein